MAKRKLRSNTLTNLLPNSKSDLPKSSLATDTFKPKEETTPTNTQGRQSKIQYTSSEIPKDSKNFYLGNKQVTRQEYNQYKGLAGGEADNPILKEREQIEGAISARKGMLGTDFIRPEDMKQEPVNLGGVDTKPVLTQEDLLKNVPQQPLLENLQATGAGVIGGATGALGGAALGAKVGALGGAALGPVGAVIGGVGGAVVGAIGGAYAKITIDKRNDASQAAKVAAIAYKNLGQTTDALNAGLIDRDTALRRWKEDQITLYASQANLKKLTDTKTQQFLSGGADELAKIQDMIDDLETWKTQELTLALSNPNPANVKYVYQTSTEQENI